MADLRYRTFRAQVYGRLCPANLSAEERASFLEILGQHDEDGLVRFFESHPLDGRAQKALTLLKEAREIADRLNILDRTLPALPHAEIGDAYARLRQLGAEIESLQTADAA